MHMRDAEKDQAPSGKGYIIQLTGKHFHFADEDVNPENYKQNGVNYVASTLLKNLQKWRIDVKNPQTGLKEGEVPVRQMGITHPAITDSQPVMNVIYYEGGPNAAFEQPDLSRGGAPAGLPAGIPTARTPARAPIAAP